MIATLLAGMTLIVSADPTPKADAEKRAAALVQQLGDPSFKAREKASAELERLGADALDALRKGSSHRDMEISERCRKLLPLAFKIHVRQQLEILTNEPDRPIPSDLPSIKRWVQIAGSGKESRILYAALVRQHGSLLIEIELHPEKVAEIFQDYCQDVFQREQSDALDARVEPVALSELAIFLFLAGDPKCRTNNEAQGPRSYSYGSVFLNSPHLTKALAGEFADDAVKKIFLSWLGVCPNIHR